MSTLNCQDCQKDCFLKGCPTNDFSSNLFAEWALEQIEVSALQAEQMLLFLILVQPEVVHYALGKIRELAGQNKLGYYDLLCKIKNNYSSIAKFIKDKNAVLVAIRENNVEAVVNYLDKYPGEFHPLMMYAGSVNPSLQDALMSFAVQVQEEKNILR